MDKQITSTPHQYGDKHFLPEFTMHTFPPRNKDCVSLPCLQKEFSSVDFLTEQDCNLSKEKMSLSFLTVVMQTNVACDGQADVLNLTVQLHREHT